MRLKHIIFQSRKKVRWLSSVKHNLHILASFNSKEFTTCGEPRGPPTGIILFLFFILESLDQWGQGKPEYVVVSGP